jgi:hypothetical protein
MERQHLAGHSPARSQRSVTIHGGGLQAREVSFENVARFCKSPPDLQNRATKARHISQL